MIQTTKLAIASVLIASAIAVTALSVSFLYLNEKHLTEKSLIELNIDSIAGKRNFKLEEARKSGYSDKEIAAYLVATDQAEFDILWRRILYGVCTAYAVTILAIGATTLIRGSNVISKKA